MYRVTGAGGESSDREAAGAGLAMGPRRQAVEGVRAHLKNVDRIGGQYAVRHLGCTGVAGWTLTGKGGRSLAGGSMG